MARQRGTFDASFSLEPNIASSLDARELCSTYADLTLDETWNDSNGNNFVYKGMKVTVTDDTDVSKNGIYLLKDLPYNNSENWQKLGLDSKPYEINIMTDTVIGGGLAKEKTTETGEVVVDENGKLWYGVTGLYGFNINSDGILEMEYDDGTSPPKYSINSDGELEVEING